MKIKFNWGTAIVLTLVLFMAALLSFVVFAWQQDVNLVYKDYYEKGVDYSVRMDVDRRSAPYSGMITIENQGDSVRILLTRNLAAFIDSGNVMFFRPSDHNKDISFPLVLRDCTVTTGKDNLIPGRYIVKFNWKAGDIEYEVDKTFIVK
jgi:hypothetical protein